MVSDRKTKAPASRLVDMLISRYRAEPDRFREFLPDVAQMLDAMTPAPRRARSPFGLSENERVHRQESLREVLKRLASLAGSVEDAIRGLEHCASLIEDDSLPDYANHKTLVQLLSAAIGKPLGSVRTRQRFLERQ